MSENEGVNRQTEERALVPPASFGKDHFTAAKLGDVRRSRCLVDLADRIARHPSGTLPDKFKDPLALRRCYDLMNADGVTHRSVLSAHVSRTLERICQHSGVVLDLCDFTELDYSGLKSLHEHLGQIGNGHGHGYECMNCLAVLPEDRTVLGLLNQILHVRDRVAKNETMQQRRDRETRETLLWLRATEGVKQATEDYCRERDLPGLPACVLLVDVCDRGADTFEFIDHEDRLNRKYVIRSCHNRSIRIGHDGEGEKALLHDHLRTLASQGQRTVELAEREGSPARQANVCVAWAAVELQLPQNTRGIYRERALKVWAVRVWEPDPPEGSEAVEWFLLSNVEVQTLSRAWDIADWYSCRWVIEELHKAKKTGCDIEKLQFTTVEALQPMIALLSVVAILLLNLRNASRDETAQQRPATDYVDEEYVEVLSGWRYKGYRALTVSEFFLALARLGGHQNRKKDKRPGWLVLWRGWRSLQLMVEGARASRRARANPADPARPSGRSPTPHARE